MTKRDQLGSFELIVILVLIRLGDNAYGVPISEELERRTGRDVAIGSVYAALERLEERVLSHPSLASLPQSVVDGRRSISMSLRED
jgi:hypothetical protein